MQHEAVIFGNGHHTTKYVLNILRKKKFKLKRDLFSSQLLTEFIGDWEGPTAGIDDVQKGKFPTLPGLKLRPLGRPVRSQSLYRLRYPRSV
jgi:hypothetical protein